MVPSLSSLSLVQFLLLAATPVFSDTNGISSRDIMEEMEHIMVDNFGTNNDGFVNAITPCSKYVSGSSKTGQQTSAQWVRFAFHDMVTHDASSGTGGIDASLGFESERAENLGGSFINDTLQFFSPLVSAYMSMSDAIALGVVLSVAACGGSSTDIPIRTGRIDASEAGPSGVPEPTTDIETTFDRFATAGWNTSDAIALTACGHSLGNIHYSAFPTIVDNSTVSVNNTDGAVGFDETPAVFDSTVVSDYIDGTGSAGGPLVTTSNVTSRSDYRLYISDKNATMQSIADNDAFQSKCNALFEKMINTVPSTVTLSDIITPLTWKAVDVQLDINSTGTVTVAGEIRYLYDISTTTAPTTVAYTYTSASGNSSSFDSDTVSGTGYSLYGNTSYFDFNTTLESPGSTAINFETVSYPINDEIFILPTQSTINTTTKAVVLKAAALTSLATSNMTATFYVPTTQSYTKTLAVKNVTVDMTEYATAGDYTIYTSAVTVLDDNASIVAKVIQGGSVSSTIKSALFVGGI